MFHHGENQFPWICVEIKNSENLWVKTRRKNKIRLQDVIKSDRIKFDVTKLDRIQFDVMN